MNELNERALWQLQETVNSLSSRVERLEALNACLNPMASNKKELISPLLEGLDLEQLRGRHAELQQRIQQQSSPALSITMAAPAREEGAPTVSFPEQGLKRSSHYQHGPAERGTQDIEQDQKNILGESQSTDSIEEEEEEEEPDTNDKSLETQIGLYWLSRLGVGFLVVGVALLIGYSFQYFNEWLKIFTGFAVAAGLIIGGEHVDRKQDMRWFGNALAGGGWSLAFFTSYAMHHIPIVKVIEDPIVGSLAMFSVAGAAVLHSLKKNSELIASLATMLGFITLSLTEVGPFSAMASMLLSLAFASLVHKQRWTGLYCTGILSSLCFTFFRINSGMDIVSNPLVRAEMMIAFVLPNLGAATLLPASFGEATNKLQSTAIGMVLLTAFCSYGALHPCLAALLSNPDAWIYGLGSVFFLLSAWLMKRKNCSNNCLLHMLLFLSCVTLFISTANNGSIRLLADSIQLALVLWAGLKYNIKSFRIFAYPLSMLTFFSCMFEIMNTKTFVFLGAELHWSLINILPALMTFAWATIAFESDTFKKTVSSSVKDFSFYWYLHLAVLGAIDLVPLLLSNKEIASTGPGTGILIAGWTAVATILGLVSNKWQRTYPVFLAMLLFLLPGSTSLFGTAIPQHVIPTLIGIAVTFGLAFNAKNSEFKALLQFRAFFAIAVLWGLFYQATLLTLPQDLCSALSIETVLLIIAGSKMKDSFVRNLALLTATLLSVQLLDARLTWLSILPGVATLFAAGEIYRRIMSNENEASIGKADYISQGKDHVSEVEGDGRQVLIPPDLIRHIYNYLATAVLTWFIGYRLENHFISCGWALEGLALLCSGFLVSDKLLRMSGLAIYALLVCRLMAVELAGAETMHRIFSFIFAGILFMIAAYAYNWFSKKLEPES